MKPRDKFVTRAVIAVRPCDARFQLDWRFGVDSRQQLNGLPLLAVLLHHEPQTAANGVQQPRARRWPRPDRALQLAAQISDETSTTFLCRRPKSVGPSNQLREPVRVRTYARRGPCARLGVCRSYVRVLRFVRGSTREQVNGYEDTPLTSFRHLETFRKSTENSTPACVSPQTESCAVEHRATPAGNVRKPPACRP